MLLIRYTRKKGLADPKASKTLLKDNENISPCVFYKIKKLIHLTWQLPALGMTALTNMVISRITE